MAMVKQDPNYPLFRKKIGFMPDFTGSLLAEDEELTGDKNGVNNLFTLNHVPIPKTLKVHKNGMHMAIEKDYTLDRTAKTITFKDHQIPQSVDTLVVATYKHY